jgi:hypothetical protein
MRTVATKSSEDRAVTIAAIRTIRSVLVTPAVRHCHIACTAMTTTTTPVSGYHSTTCTVKFSELGSDSQIHRFTTDSRKHDECAHQEATQLCVR